MYWDNSQISIQTTDKYHIVAHKHIFFPNFHIENLGYGFYAERNYRKNIRPNINNNVCTDD